MSVRIRTGYSFRHAVGLPEEVVAWASKMAWPALPIVDTASAFGWVKWAAACKKADVRPAFGMELAVALEPGGIHTAKPLFDMVSFLAQDQIEPISALYATATKQFRYQPLLSFEQAFAAAGVTRILGHRATTEMLTLAAADPNSYVALSPAVSPGYFKLANRLGVKWVAASDNRYLGLGDRQLYNVICGRDAQMQTYPQHLMNDPEWAQTMDWVPPEMLGIALNNRDRILADSTAELLQTQLLTPTRPEDGLLGLCKAGALRKGIDLTEPAYAARLERELTLLENKGFVDYMLIIADLVQWARKIMVVGPARGSSCGSLVCYLTDITTIDPLPFGLLFERFVDINRNDLPDIDLDFEAGRREEVFDYLKTRYGLSHVARLGTVSTYQPRSALQEAAAALNIPRFKLNLVLDAIVERSSGDARALQAVEDTLKDTAQGRDLLQEYPEIRIAARMEGHPRHASIHAAGAVITRLPVGATIPVDARSDVAQLDKKDAEKLDMLKIDVLGLTQLDIFGAALKAIGLPHDYLISLPLDDPAAFEKFDRRQLAGIFQFNGPSLASIVRQIHTDHIEDIISITALARPGPLNTGGATRWVNIKNGVNPVEYPHPSFEPHLKTTYGVITYQEQVMTIGREIGDLSWEDVTLLRKAMSKSLGKEYFDQFGDRWKAGARLKGIPEALLTQIWDHLCAYGSWSFNRSHSVAYGLISYWCAWLKAYHPYEFAAATLSHTDSTAAMIELLRELDTEGIKYLPFHPELSTAEWTVGTVDGVKLLIGPLTLIKGLGPAKTAAILSARAEGRAIPASAAKLLAAPKTEIDSLWPIGDRIRAIMPDPKAKNIFTAPTPIDRAVCVPGQHSEVVLFCTCKSIKPKDENEEINVARRKGQRLTGPTAALNLWLQDDSGQVFAKVDRFNFEAMGRAVMERGRAGKALYAFKGTIPPDFRMLRVTNIRYIGDMEIDELVEEKQLAG